MLRPIIDSPLPPGNQVLCLQFFQVLLSLPYLLEIIGVFFLIYIVRVFIDAKMPSDSVDKRDVQPCYNSHIINNQFYHQLNQLFNLFLRNSSSDSSLNGIQPFLFMLIQINLDFCIIKLVCWMKRRQTLQKDMVITSKQTYTMGENIFCCKCFECLKGDIVLTSDVRRQTLQRMIKNFVIEDEQDEVVEDSIKLMILIYLCLDENIPKKFINRCQINPDHSTEVYRTDLQFYIPQVCNYVVFHNDLKQNYLTQAIGRACKLNFYFAHAYYFYIVSLQKVVGNEEIHTFKKVTDYKDALLDELCKFYNGQMLNSVESYLGEPIKTVSTKPDIAYVMQMYGSKEQYQHNFRVKASDITLPNYTSIFNREQEQIYSFKSTINFFQDLFLASEQLKNYQNKEEKLHEFLREINFKLPSCVYIPFTKCSNSFYNVLNIVVEETRIFSTKMRAPFYVCLEIYNPIEAFSEQTKNRYYQKIHKPITLRQTLPGEIVLMPRKSDQQVRPKTKKYHQKVTHKNDNNSTAHTEIFSDRNNSFLNNKLLQYSNEMKTQPSLFKSEKVEVQMKGISKKQVSKKFHEMFGENEIQMSARIKQKSIYNQLKSWKLVHLIVKTGDNLKQEQFALQLIYQFDYIFKLQNLPLLLTPYQVISMGPDCGIIQMVKDSITFDKLKKHLKNDFGKALTLKQCFQLYFPEDLVEAKETFMKSLAAYSLVMYFLQAKDRHNGNILLHKSGKIFHIDFGFFLSNMPGKGVEIEKDCPFKLLSQYIDVLDGYGSSYFKTFKQYLFQGFKAIRKHQNKILMLVKMMYSSSGTSMPCFEKGQQAIRQIELRFNPPNVKNEADLHAHCQNLINSSLDNWAMKLYDRFQYFSQDIFY